MATMKAMNAMKAKAMKKKAMKAKAAAPAPAMKAMKKKAMKAKAAAPAPAPSCADLLAPVISIMRSIKVIEWHIQDLWHRRNFADPGPLPVAGGDVHDDMPLKAMKAMNAMKVMKAMKK